MPTLNVRQAFALALQHHQAGRLSEAESLYRQILAVQPNHAETHHHLGVIAHQAGRDDLAAERIRQALILDPNNPTAHSNFGNALAEQGFLDEAIAAFHRALRLKPDYQKVHYNLGNALRRRGQLDEAALAYRRALQLEPSFPEAHINLGSVLREKGQLDQAMTEFCRALKLKPDYPEAHNNLGDALAEQGRFEEATASFFRALQLKPDDARAKFNYSLLLLLRGDFECAWPLFEERCVALHYTDRRFSKPPWDGRILNGQRVLVHAEHGFGDSIHFIRYAPLIARRGGEVVVECQRALVELFRSVQGVSEVVATGDTLPAFDLHVPMLSQPFIFKTTFQSIPHEVPYLFTESSRREAWRGRVRSDRSRLKVGITWAGIPRTIHLQKRHIPLESLLPLWCVGGVDFFCLQIGDGLKQLRQTPSASSIVDHTEHINDFADTAALIAELDLIISVDTAVAHLAGALGQPVWTLLSVVPDWRWGLKSERTPWYPTMRLFRQLVAGDWDSVIQQVAESLSRAAMEKLWTCNSLKGNDQNALASLHS